MILFWSPVGEWSYLGICPHEVAFPWVVWECAKKGSVWWMSRDGSSKPSDGVEMDPQMHCATFLRENEVQIYSSEDKAIVRGHLTCLICIILLNIHKWSFKVDKDIPILQRRKVRLRRVTWLVKFTQLVGAGDRTDTQACRFQHRLSLLWPFLYPFGSERHRVQVVRTSLLRCSYWTSGPLDWMKLCSVFSVPSLLK